MNLAHSEQILVDVALVAEIRAAGGDVRLLLPILRNDARLFFPRPDFLQLIQTSLITAQYQFPDAFPKPKKIRRWIVPGDVVALATRARKVSSGYCTRMLDRLQNWSNQAWSVPEKVTVAAPEVKPEPVPIFQPPAPKRVQSNSCGYETTLKVHCVDGELVDSQGYDRGICPSCLGRKGAA